MVSGQVAVSVGQVGFGKMFDLLNDFAFVE